MSANQPALLIRDIVDLSEMLELEELQKEVWGVDDREVFPALALRPITAVGGLLLGAFVGGKLAGFVFAFPGLEEGNVILHSDMLAVRPEYRSRGIGYKLKLAQRDRALQKRVERITWTFDPLQLVNANLNFAKLAGTSDRYLVNFYGETSSFLHSSGTDRLWLTWHLNSERVRRRLTEQSEQTLWNAFDQASVAVRVTHDDEPLVVNDQPTAPSVVIEIPDKINSLPDGLRLRWRKATREAFTRTMDSGYLVEEFQMIKANQKTRGRYLLRQSKADRASH